MQRKSLLKRILALILLIFSLNFLAGKFYLYLSVWFFDMPMHFLGGFWLCLAFVFILNVSEIRRREALKIILGILTVGIGWEVFELVFVNYVASNSFNILDTISDICFDLAGGLTAFVYIFKNTHRVL